MGGNSIHILGHSTQFQKKKIKELTRIQETDTWLAPRFPVVIKQLEKWLGNQSFIFSSWGEDDRAVLLKNLLFYQLSVGKFKQYINLQHAFSTLIDNIDGNQIGLVKAIESLGLTFEGTPHSSNDAFNTARIFIEVYEKLPIDIEPFVSNQLLDNDYRKLVNKVVHLREKLGLNYHELSLVSKIKEEELEKIELFQLTKGKKEIKSLIQILYSIRGETIGKK
ncbi:3'-5' exonuclease [Terrilactibacillus sp. S3-3]|nr:3'-5' exonuclease [Terrilactibacillus sp. S3-3]